MLWVWYGVSPLWTSALIGERLQCVSKTAGERSGCCMLRSCFALKVHRQLCGAETNETVTGLGFEIPFCID